MKTAFLIIDVQNIMFTHDGGVYKADETLDNIYRILCKVRDLSVPVFYIQHTDKSIKALFEGAKTWGIHGKIKPVKGEKVIKKSSWDSFYNTDLHKELQKQKIEKLIIAGMQTEFCLDTTCRRAFSMGYKNTLISDGHTTFDSDDLEAFKIINHHNTVLGGRFVELKTTDEVLDSLNPLGFA